jgi:hypothetical protein
MNDKITIVDITKWQKKPNSAEQLLGELEFLWKDINSCLESENMDYIKKKLKETRDDSIKYVKEN